MTPKELGAHIDTRKIRRLVHSLHAILLLLVFAATVAVISISSVLAVPIGARSLSLSSAAASAVANHSFSMALNSALSIGSISIEYCAESPLFGATCSAPTGFDLSSANISSQSGETGFSIHPSSTASKIILSRAPSMAIPGVSTYVFSNVTNPSQSNSSAFVRVATYASNNGSGTRIDEGGLAFAITNPLNITADIPPYLTLCTGITVSVDCSAADGSSINFGELSENSTAAATSQFAIASNDDTGYNAYILGSTLTSGIHEIPQNNSQSASNRGSGQFGLNLVANSSPTVGGGSDGSGTGIVNTSYDDSDLFKFSSGDLVASSAQSTEFNRFTLSYVVNVSADQPPGLYRATMTILGVADF